MYWRIRSQFNVNGPFAGTRHQPCYSPPRLALIWAAALFLIAVPLESVFARTALVIGNSSYETISPLKNPANDAQDMATTLRGLGFEVIHLENAERREMRRAVRSFESKLEEKGGVGLFYYAGHGAQVQDANYLIPVDADIRREYEVPDETISAQSVLDAMAFAGNELNIVILDACRNNPFPGATRAARNGLARMNAPTGMMIAYATAPGSVAFDGEGRNGIYTKNLLEAINQPGLSIERVFKKVRGGVMSDTDGDQTPWEESSLTGDFFFIESPSNSGNTEIATTPSSLDFSVWEAISESRNPRDFDAFVEKFPDSPLVGFAMNRADALRQEAAASGEAKVEVAAVDPEPERQARSQDPLVKEWYSRIAVNNIKWTVSVRPDPTWGHIAYIKSKGDAFPCSGVLAIKPEKSWRWTTELLSGSCKSKIETEGRMKFYQEEDGDYAKWEFTWLGRGRKVTATLYPRFFGEETIDVVKKLGEFYQGEGARLGAVAPTEELLAASSAPDDPIMGKWTASSRGIDWTLTIDSFQGNRYIGSVNAADELGRCSGKVFIVRNDTRDYSYDIVSGGCKEDYAAQGRFKLKTRSGKEIISWTYKRHAQGRPYTSALSKRPDS